MELTQDTRAAIVAAARELMFEKGFDATTMRAIAERAGVSLGNAYYYFASKEHLVQAFYDHIQVEHAAAAHEALAGSEKFADRLRAVLTTWVDVAESFHGFAGKFFKVVKVLPSGRAIITHTWEGVTYTGVAYDVHDGSVLLVIV